MTSELPGAAVSIINRALIGFLAVDPATGAMYTLEPKTVDATLEAAKRGAAMSGLDISLVVGSSPSEREASQLKPKTPH